MFLFAVKCKVKCLIIAIFVSVDDLRRLIEKAGGKFEGHLYSESVTMIASMESPNEVNFE